MGFNMYVPTRIFLEQVNNLYTQKMPDKKAIVVISKGKSARANWYLARTVEISCDFIVALGDRIELRIEDYAGTEKISYLPKNFQRKMHHQEVILQLEILLMIWALSAVYLKYYY